MFTAEAALTYKSEGQPVNMFNLSYLFYFIVSKDLCSRGGLELLMQPLWLKFVLSLGHVVQP